jgi:hypothetical protein
MMIGSTHPWGMIIGRLIVSVAILTCLGAPAFAEAEEAARSRETVDSPSAVSDAARRASTSSAPESAPGEPSVEEAPTRDDPDAQAEPPPPDAEPASDPLTVPPEPPVEVTWAQRVLEVGEQIDMGMLERNQADVLYHALADDLWAYQSEVYAALRARAPDALDRREKLAEMYRARVRLLDWVTPGLRATLLGGGAEGMREVRREFDNAKLDVLFQTLAIPEGLAQIVEGMRESPLDDLWRLMQLLFGVIIFRTWRRWAKLGLANVRQSVLSIRPQTEVHTQVARLIWYFDRFRGPLEWLALLFFTSAIFEPGDLQEISTLIWVVVLWTLLTRFGLLLVEALAPRSVEGRIAGLRLRSLRLVATWILMTGLGLDLTSRYVEEAAIHSWASRAFTFLLLPLSFLLLHWWRSDIIRRLKEDSSFSTTARRMGKADRGLTGYVNAAAGVAYIVGADLLKLATQFASRFEGGRKIVATLLRREVERGAGENARESPITEALGLELLTPDETVIDGPYKAGIDRIQEVLRTGRGATIAVLAERGGGLNTFLRLLREDVGESMRIIETPPGGPEKFREALADEFDIPKEADLVTELRPRLIAAGVRIVAVGNYHRIARPKLGGLEGMLRAAELSEAGGRDIVWIVTMTRDSWPYIKGMLGDRAILQEIIEIAPWSEAQLEELYQTRCKKAQIKPDFRRLVFPRQFDDGERASLEERNRAAYRRVLWELSDGNPEVAIRLFADSLRELPSGQLIVRLPQPAALNKIATANQTTLLILKVLLETEMATIEDLEQGIRAPRSSVTNSIAHCIQEGWVETVYDHYQIKWGAYRAVKRVLVRQGLISR